MMKRAFSAALSALLALCAPASSFAGARAGGASLSAAPLVINLPGAAAAPLDPPAGINAPPGLGLNALPASAVASRGAFGPAAASDTASVTAAAAAAFVEGAEATENTGRSRSVQRAVALAIMMAGSLNVSRTALVGRRFFAEAALTNDSVRSVAEDNFRAASEFVFDNAKRLPVDRGTVVAVNRMLTRGLVPDEILGDADYHKDTAPFYRWLESDAARQLEASDPVAMAEELHFRIGLLDAFPDGNGRTARLMSDMILIKYGLAPAYYTDVDDYFRRGSPKSRVRPHERREYFHAVVRRGGEALAAPAERIPELVVPQLPGEEALRLLLVDPQHQGAPVKSRRKS